MKATAKAPSNIAFIKYWGRKDEDLRLPENGSISMNLSDLITTTTVEFGDFEEDYIEINGNVEDPKYSRAIKHIDRIRHLANIKLKAKVISSNNFPTGTGLSSSASGFAALTLSGVKAAGLDLSEKELSILARQGSGSACRSIPDGIVEWRDGNNSEESYSESIFPADYFKISDVIAVVSTEKKFLATSEGQKSAKSSIFFQKRIEHIPDKIIKIKSLIKDKNFTQFGELIEAEALEFHSILFTSNPPLIYWTPQTLDVMKYVQSLRRNGLECYFTINTGQDIHVICRNIDSEKVKKELEKLTCITKTIVNYSAKGAEIV